ncbi:GNAT family N-acetyltransferase [Flavobacterium rhamnosiphilum]|uniref:GNAT family N-acetyltransferase n=1 Tax=Flavobacterium rhamnosiphilum TaxID=2541724 RepID=A0A4R5F6U8_9FLAO|nr:GNAT family N-acetyltransferase [Flavobacterium rhamnosiphilum]TDE43167.1 GNAT family N-acetyltransferase [Flavobacterium rhamnosiphilum]
MSQLSETLNSGHKKKDFFCGKEMLDDYLQKQANQDIRRKLSACFVLIDKETGFISGYYTLANNSISLDLVPSELQKQLPKSYTSIPTTLIGRLAVDRKFQGNGTGKLLLIDALKRSYELSKNIGSFAVIVDPLDEDAVNFYSKYGFITLPDSGKMFLPMKTISSLFE